MEHAAPSEVVGRLDQLVRSMEETPFATLLYAVIDLRDWSVRIANAAHLPPLVIQPRGGAGFLELSRSAPLGMVAGRRGEDEARLEPGSTFVAYTDGLIGRRGQPVDDGFARLGSVGGRLSADVKPAEVCELLTRELLDTEAQDDALLLVSRPLPLEGRFELSLPAAPDSLAVLRRALTNWLEAAGTGAADVGAIVLACAEAASNVVEHAYGPGDGAIEFRASREGEGIELEIRDRGRWRPQRGVDHGRGSGLMSVLMDDAVVETGDGGTTVTLRKRLVREEAQQSTSSAS
jgi:anti-sigma regulatory factor (Ser/Thr protein kinase)